MSKRSIHFAKYQGGGNDFILIDARTQGEEWIEPLFIRRLCRRHFGIGADGVITIHSSEKADCRMRIFNADGSEPAMCGNGIRCAAHFVGMTEELTIETMAGVRHCRRVGEEIAVRMGAPQVLHWPVECLGQKVFVVDTGVPHAVLFVEALENIDVAEQGNALRFHPQFAPHGVNVNFVQLQLQGNLAIRTYERGVEAETQSCGTGAAAAAFVAKELFGLGSSVKIAALSQLGEPDELQFHLSSEIEMVGPATPVFEGVFSLH